MVEDAAEFVWTVLGWVLEGALDWLPAVEGAGDDRARPVPSPEQEQRPPERMER